MRKLSKSINSLLGMEVPPEVTDLFRNIVMASYQLQPKRVNDVKNNSNHYRIIKA